MNQEDIKKKAFDFLNAQAVAILSTVSDKSTPHASSLYFVIDESLTFYFLTKSSTKRVLHIKRNDNVAIVVAHNSLPLSVEIEGIASTVSDPQKQRDVIDQIAEKSAQQGKSYWPPPVSQLQDGELSVIKVTPTKAFYCDFSEGQVGKANISQIIP